MQSPAREIPQLRLAIWTRDEQCLVLEYRFGGATRHRVVIPVVIPQFQSVGMTTLWRVAAWSAYPIIWHTAISSCA